MLLTPAAFYKNWKTAFDVSQVLMYRSAYFAKVFTGQMSPDHPEFKRMVDEKTAAFVKGQTALCFAWQKVLLDTAFGKPTHSSVNKLLDEAFNPSRRTVAGNVKRLGKR